LKQPEQKLQKAVCKYLKLQYPEAFFNGSLGGQYQKYYSQRKKKSESGYQKGFPDLFIYEVKSGWSGLAIELKVKGNYPSEHQKRVLNILNEKGFKAIVCTGIDEAIFEIDKYMKYK
jgi:hypothetical protein